VYTTLPANQVIPDGPDPLWWRANCFGMTVPGLPVVDGVGPYHERFLSWFLDRYSLEWQETILEMYVSRGYTHFTLSLQDSMNGAGFSLEDFVETCLRVKAAGIPYVHVQLLSKLWTPESCTWDNYARDVVTPALNALIAAKAVDHVSNWEMNLTWQSQPENMQTVVDGIANIVNAAPYKVHQWVHFSPHYTSWGPSPHDRFQWWPAQRGKLTGVLFQGYGWAEDYPPGTDHWPAGDMQARAVDTLLQFARGDQQNIDGPFLFTYWEDCATQQFYDAGCTEDIGDLRGWEALCSQLPGHDTVPIAGFGNGARASDGSSLLKHW
jgi:hypothetical protein